MTLIPAVHSFKNQLHSFLVSIKTNASYFDVITSKFEMMKAKKNPKADLRKQSPLYFMIGLTAVLCMSYTVIEWKTFNDTTGPLIDLNTPPSIKTEELPPVVKWPEPPKPKIKTPPIIDIADNDEDIVETPIESNEPDQNTQIANVSDIEVATVDEPEEVPFAVIEDVPVFPGCEKAADKRACFQEMVQKHIRKNFRYPDEAQEMNLQGKVYVQFTVQKDGSIAGLRLRGPHKILEKEASRIISKLPKMTPGKQRGTPVKVPFAIPISFKLQ